MRIGIDAMGGDNAPAAILDGVELAFNENLDADIVLYGDDTLLQRQFLKDGAKFDRLEVVGCSETIEADDKPVSAIRSKKDSSIVRACADLKSGAIDAFVCAGNTGALLAAGTLVTGRLKGIKRPALTTAYPTENGFAVLSDVGANADCSALNILQFAQMSSLYSKEVLGVENPKVGLLNIGTEATKGTALYQDAHKLLSQDKSINFIGNIESRDLLKGICDVVVCDGFTGNIALKLIEGAAMSVMGMIKNVLMSSTKAKFAALLIKDPLRGLKARMSSSSFGGAPLLGTLAPVVKAHGSSDALAIKNAILYAHKYASSDLIKNLSAILKEDNGES